MLTYCIQSYIDTGSENIFSIGAKTDVAKSNNTKKVHQKGEDRLANTLAINDPKKDAKRDRDNYAVNLRKQKR